MELQKPLFSVLAFLLLLLISSCHGYKFFVGGRDGWVMNPPENYNHWAERNRFQVNDTLYFKYEKGNDSVELVTRENYNQCNPKHPIKSLTEGESEYKFERSGPHYFISGNDDHCRKGQKLIVVVLALRPTKSPPTPTITPPSAAPVSSPPSPSHAPPAPGSTSPSQTPESGPAPAPSPSTPDNPSQNSDRNSGPFFGSSNVVMLLGLALLGGFY